MNNQELFLYWVKERLQIYYSKESNEPKPWTKDTILQQYKFCNVHREHDTVTKWIKYNWRDKYPDCTKSDSRKNDMYLKIVSNSMNGLTEEEGKKNISKIISNVAKEVVIDKY